MTFLRARLDQYQRLYGRLRTRALVMIVIGSIALVIGAFLSFLGLLLAVVPDGGIWEKRSSYFVGVIGGLFPLIGAAIAIWRGLVGRRRAHQARDIVALARLTPVFGSRDVAQHLALRPFDAERAVLDAIAHGFVEEAPAPPELLAASGVGASSGSTWGAWQTSPAESAGLAATGPAGRTASHEHGTRRASPAPRAAKMASSSSPHPPR